MAGRKYGANVFEIANRATLEAIGAATIPDITAELLAHESGSSTNAHQISNINGLQGVLDGKSNTTHTHNISNVTGLQTALDGKQSVLTGFTGSFSVVTHVDFPGGTVTTKTITVSNGVIVSVV